MKTSYDYLYKKIIEVGDYNRMSELVNEYRNSDKRIVFTNGCFDIVHYGHIDSLSRASNEGDILIVGLNSDISVKKLKGHNRPIHYERARAIVLASLHCVDMVVVFEEDTPEYIIDIIRPDVLVKGCEYEIANIAGADIVKSYGGDIVRLPVLSGFSTTDILRKIMI